jgi:hypothetical protein
MIPYIKAFAEIDGKHGKWAPILIYERQRQIKRCENVYDFPCTVVSQVRAAKLRSSPQVWISIVWFQSQNNIFIHKTDEIENLNKNVLLTSISA